MFSGAILLLLSALSSNHSWIHFLTIRCRCFSVLLLYSDKKIKRACCKNCHSLLVPGHTQKTTVKTQPPTLIRTCTFCGGERRFVHQNRKTDTVKLLPGGPVQVFARGDENPHDILRWKEEVKNRETEQSAGGALTPGGMNRPPFPTHGSSNRSSTSTDDNNGNNSADCSQRKRQAPSSPSYGSSKRRTPSSPSYGSSSSSSPSSSLRHQTPRSPSYGGSLRR